MAEMAVLSAKGTTLYFFRRQYFLNTDLIDQMLAAQVR